MSLETITSVDINFSNGADGHSANVSSTLEVKNSDGSPSLGVVNGEIGSKNYFSQDEINNIMSRFVCTSLNKSKSPIGTTVSRRYSDVTSLTLRSYLVMVRGINAPPDNKDSFEGLFPFFSETKGSPLESFPSVKFREMDGKRVLIVGKIYNYESASVLSGLKVSLVYQNKELVDNLSLNKDTVTQTYKDFPNLLNYGLKFGYTLNEYLEMLDYVGVKHKGLEDIENGDTILFQNSGTLAEVTSAIASYFGYYYFIDPNTGDLNFIDSRIASDIEITDYTQSTDENIVSATFSEEKFTPEIVNAYIGSADKPDVSSQGGRFRMGGENGDFSRKKRVTMHQVDNPEATQSQNKNLNLTAIKIFFDFFNSDLKDSDEIFNKYVYCIILNNVLFNQALRDNFRGGRNNDIPPIDFGGLFPNQVKSFIRYSWLQKKFEKNKVGTKKIGNGFSFTESESEKKMPTLTGFDTGNDKFKPFKSNAAKISCLENINARFDVTNGRHAAAWYDLSKDVNEKQIGKPKDSELYDYLRGYFKFAGSIFCSAGMSAKRANRISLDNQKGLNIIGHFDRNTKLADINDPEFAAVYEWLVKYTAFDKNSTIGALIKRAPNIGNNAHIGKNHFIGILNTENLGIHPKDIANNNINVNTIYNYYVDATEVRDLGEKQRVLGETLVNQLRGRDIFEHTVSAMVRSRNNFDRARQQLFLTKQIKVDGIIFKEDPEGVNDGDDDENQSLIGDSEENEDLKDLIQRYDLKSYQIDAPETDQYTPLSLNVASGSTVEMAALKQSAEKNFLSIKPKPLKSSSKTIYGLEIPSEFKITINSFSIKVGSDGITTNIGESTLKLIPPDRQFTINQGMEVIGTPSINPRLKASQRNYLGL